MSVQSRSVKNSLPNTHTHSHIHTRTCIALIGEHDIYATKRAARGIPPENPVLP